MDCDAIASSPDELGSSVDVSWCNLIDLMPKPASYNLTPMCGADFVFDGFMVMRFHGHHRFRLRTRTGALERGVAVLNRILKHLYTYITRGVICVCNIN